MKRSSSWYLPGLGLESHEEDYEPAQAHEELLSKPVQEDVTKSECYVNGSYGLSLCQRPYTNMAKDKKVIPDPIDDRKFQE